MGRIDWRKFFSLKFDLLRTSVLVAVLTVLVAMLAYAFRDREIEAIPKAGKPQQGPEAKDAKRDHEALHKGDVPEPN